MADITEAIRRLIFEFVSEGADKVIKQQEDLVKTTDDTSKASLSLEKSFGSLERRYVETVRHQQDYQKVQEKVNAAVAQNPALQERANVLLAAAGEHFDKLALNANKGGIASSFLSKAITTIIGPAGLLGVAMTGVGIAVGYMAEKFISSSKTIEQVLEEQNRLMKEAKNLIDARASVEAKFNAQPPNVTRFEALQNELEVAKKLKEMSESLQSKVTAPSSLGMPEMGIAPDVSTMVAPGMEKVRGAIETLVQSITAGKPKVTEFVDELARIAIANPELAKTTQEIIKMGGPALEQAVFKARALEDALKGVATAAQLAALGYASLAQFQVGNLQAEQAAAATERQAQATLQIAASYPGMSIEVAKQLATLEGQLTVAQARTEAEKMVAQEIATINTLLAQGKTLEEATAIAAGQRAIAEANVKTAIESQIKGLQQQAELTRAQATGTQAAVKTQQAYQNAIDKGASPEDAERVAVATWDTAAATQEQADQNAENARWAQILAERKAAEARRIADEQRAAAQRQQDADAANMAFIQAYNQSLAQAQAAAQDLAYHWDRIPGIITEIVKINGQFVAQVEGLPQFKTWTDPNTGQAVQFNPAGYQSGTTFAQQMDQINAATSKLYDDMGIAFENVTQVVNGISVTTVQRTIDNLTDSNKELTNSTDSLNATMQNALSPYYSMDPRTTKLGFRAGAVANQDWTVAGASNENSLDAILGEGATAPGMAGGGSFVVGGGYSSNDNRIAAFPVASGEEIIVNRSQQQGRGGPTVINIDNRTMINGSVDEDTLARLKVTKYQQSQRMRGALARA